MAYALRDTPFKVNAVDPCFTATDITNYTGSGTVELAAKRILKAVMLTSEGPTGQFFSEEYNPQTGITTW